MRMALMWYVVRGTNHSRSCIGGESMHFLVIEPPTAVDVARAGSLWGH